MSKSGDDLGFVRVHRLAQTVASSRSSDLAACNCTSPAGPCTAFAGRSNSASAAASRYRDENVAFTVAANPRKVLNVSCTADASYPECTMQFAHFGFPDSVPYRDHSVVRINSSNV